MDTIVAEASLTRGGMKKNLVDNPQIDTALSEIWERICRYVRESVSADTFGRWFSDTHLLDCGGGKLTLGVPNNIYQVWIESNYLIILKHAAAAVLGEEVGFRFVVDDSGVNGVMTKAESDSEAGGEKQRAAGESAQEAAPAVEGLRQEQRRTGCKRLDKALESSGLNGQYEFDSFVVGSSNQFAHATSFQVAKNPARTFNPLFIYGGVGLGKTHLMQAIGRHILTTKSSSKVLYVTAERFTNDFIDALKDGTIVKFRKRYRQADVLLIDDIQFLAGKERSQEEFFHTFNSLSDGRRQIVLSSDRPPSEIATLEERLVSRFEWGVTASLQPPDLETRLAILQKKMRVFSVEISGDILRFIAENVKYNVRRLEGALTRVASLTSLNGPKLSTPELEELLKDVLDEEESNTVTIDRIQKKVAEHYDIRIADMTSKRRPANIAFPRQVAMYFARRMTDSSFNEIGEAFGGRDHGTVIHACKLIDKKMTASESIRRTIAQLENRLKGKD